MINVDDAKCVLIDGDECSSIVASNGIVGLANGLMAIMYLSYGKIIVFDSTKVIKITLNKTQIPRTILIFNFLLS